MNVSSAGPLFCIGLARGDDESRELSRRLAGWTVGLLLAGILLGLGLGYAAYFAGDGRLAGVLPFFRRKIIWGIAELVCSLVWMSGYWWWLQRARPQRFVARFCQALLPVLSATNLLYHFPPLLTVLTKTAHGELTVTEPVTAAIFRTLVYTPNVLAHTLHFCLASVAVSGVFLFWLVRRSSSADRFYVLGARVALGATLLQVPVGLWLLVVTPAASQARLLGQHGLATGLFLSALICAFYLLQYLGTLALGDVEKKAVDRATLLLLACVLLMSGTLHFLRV